MANNYRYIGKDTPRKDARNIVTGRAQYLDDVRLPNMLIGRVLRSSLPHANIKSIDVGRAAALLARYHQRMPFTTDVLTRAAGLKLQEREMFLRDWYPELPSADFSRDVLTHSFPLCLYTWSSEIGWSDLGTPERLQEWLAIGRTSHGTDDPPRGRRAA